MRLAVTCGRLRIAGGWLAHRANGGQVEAEALQGRLAALRLECRLSARHVAAPLLTWWRPEMLVTLGCMTRMKVADSPLRASKLRSLLRSSRLRLSGRLDASQLDERPWMT